jgi:hypothetical protein
MPSQGVVDDGCDLGRQVVDRGGGGDLKNREALETIGPDLTSSFRIQLVTEESEEGREPINNYLEG